MPSKEPVSHLFQSTFPDALHSPVWSKMPLLCVLRQSVPARIIAVTEFDRGTLLLCLLTRKLSLLGFPSAQPSA